MKNPPTFAKGESLRGLRRKLNQLSEAIAARTPERGKGTLLRQRPTGFSYSADPGGSEKMPPLGFTVFEAGDDPLSVRLIPSIVSGLSSSAAIPVIGGTPLDADPAPTLTLEEGQWVALRIEADPTARKQLVIANEGTESEEVVEYWEIAEGGGTLVGPITVATYADSAAMDAASRPAVVSPSSGSATSGFYIVPLARRSGGVRQWGHVGPIGIRMCSSGHAVIVSPVRASYSAT